MKNVFLSCLMLSSLLINSACKMSASVEIATWYDVKPSPAAGYCETYETGFLTYSDAEFAAEEIELSLTDPYDGYAYIVTNSKIVSLNGQYGAWVEHACGDVYVSNYVSLPVPLEDADVALDDIIFNLEDIQGYTIVRVDEDDAYTSWGEPAVIFTVWYYNPFMAYQTLGYSLASLKTPEGMAKAKAESQSKLEASMLKSISSRVTKMDAYKARMFKKFPAIMNKKKDVEIKALKAAKGDFKVLKTVSKKNIPFKHAAE